MQPADPASLRAAREKHIERLVRAIHHYGDPPDPRLQRKVDADVSEIVEECRAYAAALSGEPPAPTPEAVKCSTCGGTGIVAVIERCHCTRQRPATGSQNPQ